MSSFKYGIFVFVVFSLKSVRISVLNLIDVTIAIAHEWTENILLRVVPSDINHEGLKR